MRIIAAELLWAQSELGKLIGVWERIAIFWRKGTIVVGMNWKLILWMNIRRFKTRNGNSSMLGFRKLDRMKQLEYNETGKDNDPVDSWSPFNGSEKIQSVSAMNNFDSRTMPLALELEEKKFEANSLMDISLMRGKNKNVN